MPFEDLREFLHALEKQGELKRVALAADPYLEIAAFADRSVKTGGPALFFENPTGSNVPLVINAFASLRR
jgi:4-hydroxy-3-polyprenylbenzoate decarboxylase